MERNQGAIIKKKWRIVTKTKSLATTTTKSICISFKVSLTKLELKHLFFFFLWKMILSHHGVKWCFHTTTKRQNSYSQLTIPSLAILVTKRLFYSYFHFLPLILSIHSNIDSLSCEALSFIEVVLPRNSLLYWSSIPPKLSHPLNI